MAAGSTIASPRGTASTAGSPGSPGGPVTASPPGGAMGGKGAAAPADFLAMLGQMLQGSSDEAGAQALEALGLAQSDSETPADERDELPDPALAAESLLALTALAMPTPSVSATTARAASGVPGDTSLADESPALPSVAAGARPGSAPLALPADGLPEGAGEAESDSAPPSQGRTDPAQATPVSVAQQASVGQLTTQLLTQVPAPAFAAADAPATPVPQRVVHASVGTTAWANELGTRLTLMAAQGQHSASLRLSPEHLGPLEVRIEVNDDKASVWFGAQHADTRAALNEALPRLRELFAASGMTLADSGVSQQAPRQEARDNAARLAHALGGDAAVTGVATGVTSITSPGLLDLYA